MYPNELFNICGVSVDLYTICFVLGVIACFVYLSIVMKKSGYSSTASDTILVIGIFAILFGILSAVLFQSVYDYIANPSGGFKITGRMTFIGGLMGGIISYLAIYNIYVYLINPKLSDKNFFKSDMNKGAWYGVRFIPASITLAHAFGRLGCMFAGCCHGAITEEWYGMYNVSVGAKTVPIQLFEALFLFALTAVMTFLYFKFNFKYNLSIYLASYGTWRFIIEFFRDDYRGSFIGGISPSQFWSIVMVVAGIIFFFLYRKFDHVFVKEEQEPINTEETEPTVEENQKDAE